MSDVLRSRYSNPFVFSRVGSKLWISGLPPPDLKRHGYAALVLCAEEHQHHGADIPILRAPLDDALNISQDSIHRAIEVAGIVSKLRKEGHRVLVTCQMGINRSAFVAGLSLIQLEGLSPAHAVQQIREARGAAVPIRPLSNKRFVAELVKYAQQRRRSE